MSERDLWNLSGYSRQRVSVCDITASCCDVFYWTNILEGGLLSFTFPQGPMEAPHRAAPPTMTESEDVQDVTGWSVKRRHVVARSELKPGSGCWTEAGPGPGELHSGHEQTPACP